MIFDKSKIKIYFLVIVVVTLVSCTSNTSPQPKEIPVTEAAPADTRTAIPLAPTALSTSTQPPNPVTPRPEGRPTETAVPTPTPPPQPLYPFTISGMRERLFAGGQIRTRALLEENQDFARYYIDYPSDGLTITGIMHLPVGPPPFPVLILLHGYIDRGQYFSGVDTWQAADFFAQHGYLVLSPDFRSWGESDVGLSLFHTGLVADVLNLISSLPSLAEADSSRVGLWGHSMGGGVATKVLVIDSRVGAAVLYAPNSADDADLIARWGAGCLPGESEAAGDKCNPAELIPAESDPELVAAYIRAAADPDYLRQVAPLYHLETVTAPVQIHIGTADGQALVETPPEWSKNLADALQTAGKEAAYFSYPNQGHAFLGESWTILLERALSFYDEHLKVGL